MKMINKIIRIINSCSNEKESPGVLVPVIGNKNASLDGKWLEEKLRKLIK